MLQIKPCIECAGSGKIITVESHIGLGKMASFYFIMCESCGHSEVKAYLTNAEAVAHWNLVATNFTILQPVQSHAKQVIPADNNTNLHPQQLCA